MKAAVLREVNVPLEVEEVQVDAPGPREVLIRTGASGVCHSDLHYVEGSYSIPKPAILGHEAAGIVEAVGEQVTTLSRATPLSCACPYSAATVSFACEVSRSSAPAPM